MVHHSIATPWHTQNFLRHPSRVQRLVDLTMVHPDDVVLDLGAGSGQITRHLAERCSRVIAVEKDPLLAASLRAQFAERANVIVRHADALSVRLPREAYKVVANIPFDITTRLIRRLTSATYPPDEAYLAIQAEAAQRVLGQPAGTLLSALIGPFFEASIVHRFRRHDFNPPPRVDVVFLRLHKRGPPLVPRHMASLYRDLVTACFRSPKPTLRATLVPLLGYRRVQHLAVPVDATPSSLRVGDWLRLFRAVSADVEVRARLRGFSNLANDRRRGAVRLARARG